MNLVITPRLGAWADRVGAQRSRLIFACIQLVGALLLFVVGHSIWLIMIPILIQNLVGPMIDITSRMTFLDQAPEIRTRLMTIYIVMMFLGAGAASWAGTFAYDVGGWTGNAWLVVVCSSLVVLLSWISRQTKATT